MTGSAERHPGGTLPLAEGYQISLLSGVFVRFSFLRIKTEQLSFAQRGYLTLIFPSAPFFDDLFFLSFLLFQVVSWTTGVVMRASWQPCPVGVRVRVTHRRSQGHSSEKTGARHWRDKKSTISTRVTLKRIRTNKSHLASWKPRPGAFTFQEVSPCYSFIYSFPVDFWARQQHSTEKVKILVFPKWLSRKCHVIIILSHARASQPL